MPEQFDEDQVKTSVGFPAEIRAWHLPGSSLEYNKSTDKGKPIFLSQMAKNKPDHRRKNLCGLI
jgi:hypothetical protein